MNDSTEPIVQARNILAVIKELGLEPYEPPKPLPQITEDDVHFVVWRWRYTDERTLGQSIMSPAPRCCPMQSYPGRRSATVEARAGLRHAPVTISRTK